MTTSDPRATRTSLDHAALADAEAALREANLAFARRYPGGGAREAAQPAHTLIEGAQHFVHDVAARRGAAALAALDAHAPDARTLAAALALDGNAMDDVHARVRERLARTPVEDYRIDFEDGFGVRPDDEEDAHVLAVADAIARGAHDGALPPSIGVRVKAMTEELRARSVRTLDLLVTALAERGALPSPFVVTLPKVSVVAQVAYFARALEALEVTTALGEGALRLEVQLEVPQAVVDATGRAILPALVDAAGGRLDAVNLGVYDYTAACGVTAAHQGLAHPAAAFARRVMQASLAGSGVWLSDGSTAVLPVGDRAQVHAGWRRHFEDARRSLAEGFHQGWDLHAAQLVTRHAAVLSFYLEGLDAAAARLSAFLDRAKRSALVGGVLDEPATGQALLAFLQRAARAGATTEERAAAASGLTVEELREPSFVRVMRARGIAVGGPMGDVIA